MKKKETKQAQITLYDREKYGNNDVFIVESGDCRIINPKFDFEGQPKEAILAYNTVGRGDYFGESTIFKMQSLDFYGDIVAATEQVKCIQISRKDFDRIPLHELKLMQKAHEHWIKPW